MAVSQSLSCISSASTKLLPNTDRATMRNATRVMAAWASTSTAAWVAAAWVSSSATHSSAAARMRRAASTLLRLPTGSRAMRSDWRKVSAQLKQLYYLVEVKLSTATSSATTTASKPTEELKVH
nr:hypothetical protein [Tanacetum cinerariifolium]